MRNSTAQNERASTQNDTTGHSFSASSRTVCTGIGMGTTGLGLAEDVPVTRRKRSMRQRARFPVGAGKDCKIPPIATQTEYLNDYRSLDPPGIAVVVRLVERIVNT